MDTTKERQTAPNSVLLKAKRCLALFGAINGAINGTINGYNKRAPNSAKQRFAESKTLFGAVWRH